MSFYPPQIQKRFEQPRLAGSVESADAIGSNASFVCGAVLQISLRIERETITEARFQAAGCGYLTAAADLFCEKAVGKIVGEKLNIFELLENELGAFEPSRKNCLELVWQTFRAAVNDYQIKNVQNWNGDEALVCTCFGVSEKLIEAVVAENLLTTVDSVTEICRAGGGCGSCQPLIEEIINDVWRG